jgi:hypothetical protein
LSVSYSPSYFFQGGENKEKRGVNAGGNERNLVG